MIKEIMHGIGQIITSIRNGISESMYSLRIQKKSSNKFNVEIDILSDTRQIETYTGTLTPNREMAYIPKLQRPVFKPVIFQKNGKNKILLSEKQHDNMSYAVIKSLDISLKNNLEIKTKITPKCGHMILNKVIKDPQIIAEIVKNWEYENIYATLEIKNIGGSLDLTQFDNAYSVPFASQSELIINSELLKFLIKPSDMAILTTAIIGFLAGMVITFMMKGGF